MALVKVQPDPLPAAGIIPEEKGYLRVPYAFCKDTRRISDCLVRSLMYSFSSSKKDPDARCAMSYSRIQDKLNYARSTVGAAIRNAIESGKFDQDKSNRFRASYKYQPDSDSEEPTKPDSDSEEPSALPAFTVEFYLFHTAFKRKDGTAVYLPKSAIQILGLIKTHCENGGFSGSIRSIARTLGHSKTTVQAGIDLLISLDLIFRPSGGRGVNKSKISTYGVQEKLLRKAKRDYNKLQKASRPTVREQNDPTALKAERESYYARLRWAEEDRIDSFNQRLNTDGKYVALDKRRRKLEIEIAKAEVYDQASVPELMKEHRKVCADRTKRMERMGISDEDLKPKFRCDRCNDTGYDIRSGLLCDCFRRQRRRE